MADEEQRDGAGSSGRMVDSVGRPIAKPRPHRCDDRLEDFINSLFEGWSYVPGRAKIWWRCMRSEPGCGSPKSWWLSTKLAGRSSQFCTLSDGAIDSSHACKIDDSKLVKAIVYEANKGFCDSVGSTRKFSEFLRTQLSVHAEEKERDLKSCQVIHALAHDAHAYSRMDCQQRMQLLDRVAQIQGFSCAKDIVDQEIALSEASQDLGHVNCVEKQPLPESTYSPSIVYGNSAPVDIFGPKRKFSCRQTKPEAEDDETLQTPGTSRPEVAAISEKSQPSAGERSKVARTASSIIYEQAVDTTTVDTDYGSWELDNPISNMKCLTPYQRSQLQENGFFTARSLLNHFPRAHVSFESPTDKLEDGQSVALFGTIIMTKASKIKESLAMLEVVVHCRIAQECRRPSDEEVVENTVFLHIKKFFQGLRFTSTWFLNKAASGYPEGAKAAVTGKVKEMNRKSHFLLKDYAVKVVDGENFEQLQSDGEAYPVYSSKGLLNPKKIQACIQRLLKGLPSDIDPLPSELRDKYGLLSLAKSYATLHQPTKLEDANVARRRIVFDDYFYLQLAFLLQRRCKLSGITINNELEVDKWSALTQKVLNALPFQLTKGQMKAASEIMWDLRQQAPMSRLLQGDVGCGKTIVAFLALLDVVSSGYQAALMAPTEFVVSQLYKQFLSWLEVLDEKDRPKIAFLSGSLTAGEARLVREGIANKEISLILGTHALISSSTNFPALGLAVIDEQHRFGVTQRDRLKTAHAAEADLIVDDADFEKVKLASTTHVLLMSATPIPRSLALTCQGDMSLSQINEIPPGRQPVTTVVFPDNEEGRKNAYELVKGELETGGRAFFVYPLINESTVSEHQRAAVTDFDNVVREFKDYKCALAHGRMKPDVKNQELQKFRTGECQILVATKVVEVGIDVPEATVMLIESAESYGLAQLHQLRGRVGRGTRKSCCILLTSSDNLDRVKILESTTDGFRLAEEDLKMRGPGDLLGKRQSGAHVEFVLARLGEDIDVLTQARDAAEELLEADRNLEKHPRIKHEINLRQLPKSWS